MLWRKGFSLSAHIHRWSLWEPSPDDKFFQIGLETVVAALPHVRIGLENLPLASDNTSTSINAPQKSILDQIPSQQIAYCKIKSWRSEDFPKMRGLTQAENLKTLHLVGESSERPTIHPFYFDRNERLPPLKALILQDYGWYYPSEIVITMWNWTKLEILELHGVNLFNFLSSIQPHHLTQVRQLVLGSGSIRNLDETSALICVLITKITRLEHLATQCDVCDPALLPALVSQGPNLTSLSILDYKTSSESAPTVFSAQDLQTIGASCPNLRALSLDTRGTRCMEPLGAVLVNDNEPLVCMAPINPRLLEGEGQAIANFRNLQRLGLRMTFVQVPYREPEDTWLGFSQAVRAWMYSMEQ